MVNTTDEFTSAFTVRRSLLIRVVFSEPGDVEPLSSSSEVEPGDVGSLSSSSEASKVLKWLRNSEWDMEGTICNTLEHAMYILMMNSLFKKNVVEDYSSHKDSTGTLGAAFCPSEGYQMIISDSRSTDRESSHMDLNAKIQMLGPYWVIPCGDFHFANLVINKVRKVVDDTNVKDFWQVQSLFVMSIRDILRISPDWKRYKEQWGISDNYTGYSFILGSTIVRNGRFKESAFYHINPENVNLGRFACANVPPPLEASGVIAGCPNAISIVIGDLSGVDWDSMTFDKLKVVVVGAFCRAFRRSRVCGGPIDVIYLVPKYEDGRIILSQKHFVLIPELFCAQYGIKIERSGPRLIVPDYLLEEYNVERSQVGGQICNPTYSHSVERMLNRRFHHYQGERGILESNAEVVRHLFPASPVFDE